MLILLIAAAVFGGVWWGLSKLGAHVFVIAALAYLAANLVAVVL